MTRRRLPNRPPSQSFEFQHGSICAVVTVGFSWPDLKPSEIFIRASKCGSDTEAEARDGGIAVSIALQHGASLDALAHALTKNDDDSPASVVGAALLILKGKVNDENIES